MFFNFTFLLVFFLFYSTKSYAYLDPGSGSIFLQILALIMATISGVYLFFKNLIKNFFLKIKHFFLKKFKKNKN